MYARPAGRAPTRSAAGRQALVFSVFLALVGALFVGAPPPPAQAACTGNAIVCENQQPGTPASTWDVEGAGDPTIQGFATQMSVNAGSQIQFKVTTLAPSFSIEIYRLGYYQGKGARLIDTVPAGQTVAMNQDPCRTDSETEIYDCGNWSVSASWSIPSTSVSGVYIARLIRTDTGGDSHIPFVVRQDGNTSKVLFQTSDTTWQAYNTYGGSDFYKGNPKDRAYKISYNRPFATRAKDQGRDFLFSNEFPMIRFLEQNGYDVSYVAGLDVSVDPNLLPKHKVFLSVGHDEYWSADQRATVPAARDAGVNLAFFGGNDVYWKTRWEPSQDGTNTANRTLVCFKDTWADAKIDTEPGGPTPTWRDPRFGDNGFGPENSLIGTQYQANSVDLAIKVSPDEGKLRLWRNTDLVNTSTTQTLAAHTIGYESNEDVDNGSRPAGLIRLSTTTGPTPEYLTDFGGRSSVVSGTTTHHLTMYRAASKALVFSAGTIQWSWGLDSNHDGLDVPAADPRMRQATANVLADMSALPTTLADGLIMPTASDDDVAPTTTITQPAGGASIAAGDLVTVKGTTADVGGRVASVEVSVDGGATFHLAEGTGSFSYTGVVSGTGPDAIQVRATDDSANIAAPTKRAVTTTCPCSIFGALQPVTPSTDDGSAVTLGTKFTVAADGFITGIRFYKGAGNTGTHVGKLYSASGEVLATADFTSETSVGWQTVNFTSAVPVVQGQTYVAAYKAPSGHYAGDNRFFSYRGYSSGRMAALGGPGQVNGVFGVGDSFPDQSYRQSQTNYYVDAVYNTVDTTPLTVTRAIPDPGAASVSFTTDLSATFSRAIDPATLSFHLLDGTNQVVTGTTSTTANSAKFSPLQSLAPGTTYTATVTATAANGVSMAAPYQWSFTTGQVPNAPGVCPCSVFDDTVQPTSAAAADGSPVRLGMAFRPDTAGLITGIRFFKAPSSSPAHDVYLYSDAGVELAKATGSDEASSGWQAVSFANPVPVSANTTYVAAYTAPDGKYFGRSGALGSPIDAPPLHAPATAGRYTYGDGAPASTSNASYFVDPVYVYSAASAPTVIKVKPGDKATSVPVTAQVTVSFDSLIRSNTAKISVKRVSDGQAVAGTTSSETGGSTVSFTPSSALDPSTPYSVTVSDAQSASGNAMAGSVTSTFTTSGPDACPCSLMESTTTPVVSDSQDGGAVTVGLRFTSSADGLIRGLTYYRDAANTGTHIGKLWKDDRTELASVTFADSGTGWQTAMFSSPVAISAGSVYVASYYAPNGHYSANVGGFADTVVNTPLSSAGSGGVYFYGNGFPNASYLGTNYYVDVLYTPKDDGPPTVSDTTPGNGAEGAATATKPTATFADAVDPSTIAFSLTTGAGQLVTGATTYDATSRTATFTPEGTLAPSTTYTAAVTARSAAGAAMSTPKTWSFSTASNEPPVVTAFSPGAGATDVAVSVTPTAVFTKAVDSGSLVWSLKAADGGTIAGTPAYDAASRTATFRPSAALAGSTTYTATVTAASPSGTRMTAPASWSFSTVDNVAASVTATSPSDQANGIAATSAITATFDKAITQSTLSFTVKTAAGASVAGTTSYASADRKATFTATTALAGSTTYTVSVSATSAAGVAMTTPQSWSFSTADTAPPSLTNRTPAVNATGVAATTKVTAVFDKAITASTLAMTLKSAAGVTVAGSTTYDAATRTGTFTPTAALTSSTSYTASAQAGSASGVPMANATTWTFTTEAQTFSLFTTTQAPTSANTSNGTALPSTVGVRFASSRTGKVTAIRFYAGSTNTGNTVSLWTATGTRLAQATTTQTGTGWRTATFATPVSITAGTTYVASYYAPAGRYAQTTGTFSSTYTAGPLSVPASGSRSSLLNTYPTGTSSASYWVDVLVSI